MDHEIKSLSISHRLDLAHIVGAIVRPNEPRIGAFEGKISRWQLNRTIHIEVKSTTSDIRELEVEDILIRDTVTPFKELLNKKSFISINKEGLGEIHNFIEAVELWQTKEYITRKKSNQIDNHYKITFKAGAGSDNKGEKSIENPCLLYYKW